MDPAAMIAPTHVLFFKKKVLNMILLERATTEIKEKVTAADLPVGSFVYRPMFISRGSNANVVASSTNETMTWVSQG